MTADDRPARREPSEPHEWSDEEIATLLKASKEIAALPTSKYDYTPLLTLTARLGLRLGEVTGLVWSDFDKDASTLTVARQWSRRHGYQEPKTGAGKRTIPLPPDMRELLISLRLRSEHSGDECPIFASKSGTPLGHRNVTRRGFEAARDRAKLEGVCFHDLRHAAASRMIAAGLDPVTVARVLGHSNAQITLQVYAATFNRVRSDDAVRLALAGGH